MIVKYGFPLLAALGVAFAAHRVALGYKPQVVPPPVAEPARAPFADSIAASGIVEPQSEAIAISAAVGGVLVSVEAFEGADVRAGDVLFRVDDRELVAQRATLEAAVHTARARLERLLALPRPEDVAVAEARLAQADVEHAQAERQLAIVTGIDDPRAVARDELVRREWAAASAGAEQAARASELSLARAGTFAPEVGVARAELAAAEAAVAAIETEIERRVVRAPIDARVLSVEARAGEYAPAGVLARPLIVLGVVDVLHVRVDVDENEAWRFRDGAPAQAFLRGRRDVATALEFVRAEPLVVPKLSLTGASSERVDTRVLQALYRFDPARFRARVGQQVDVFVEARAEDAP